MAIVFTFIIANMLFECFKTHTLELRIIEKGGLHVVQMEQGMGLIPDWGDEKKFRSRSGAEKYMNEWYKNYNTFKEVESEIGE